MIAGRARAPGVAALLAAVALLGGCARDGRRPLPAGDLPHLPDVPAPPPRAAGSVEPPPFAAPPEPDRSEPPFSQTPFFPLPDGAVEEAADAGGRHLRLGTARGAVHVWLPARDVPPNAGLVLYVHGYYTNVDQAFVDHQLAAQFRASGREAVFVAPEAPDWNGAAVAWPDLDALLREVAARTRLRLPSGPVVVSGHSGAIRTVLAWLDDPRVEEVVLLDGLYRGEDELAAWLAGAPARRRLLLVGQETGPRTEEWLRTLPPARTAILPRIPARLGARERRAAVVYARSQVEHMALVTQGRVLPLLLGATRLPPRPSRGAAAPAAAR
jgi:hypothetical protein